MTKCDSGTASVGCAKLAVETRCHADRLIEPAHQDAGPIR